MELKHPDKKIMTREPKQVWEKLNENLSHVCETETCWLNQKFVDHGLRDKLYKTTFGQNSLKMEGKSKHLVKLIGYFKSDE